MWHLDKRRTLPGQVGRRPSGEDRRSQPHQLSEIQLCLSGGLGIVFRGAGEELLGRGGVDCRASLNNGKMVQRQKHKKGKDEIKPAA